MSWRKNEQTELHDDPFWRKKLASTPFGRVGFEVDKKTVQYRFLSEDSISYLSREIQKINLVFHGGTLGGYVDRLVPERAGAIRVFESDFEAFGETFFRINGFSGRDAEVIDYVVFDYFQCAFPGSKSGIIFNKESDFIYKFVEISGGGDNVIRTKRAEEMHREVQRQKAKYCDLGLVKKAFDQRDKTRFPNYIDREYVSAKLSRHLGERRLSTYFEVGRYFLAEYFAIRGFEGEGKLISKASTWADLRKIAEELNIERFVAAREKEFREKIRGATIEEKKAASMTISTLGERRKLLQQIKFGFTSLTEAPELYVAGMRREFDRILEYLILRQGNRGGQTQIFLDGRWNEKLDRDPGAFSGDCTEGEPLPFDRPEVPLYNVKVFEGDRHVGNIYLYVTTTEYVRRGEEGKVWHLDAIQLPESNLDTDLFVDSMVKILAQEAEKQGVSYITVNSVDSQISNYDYVVESVLGYWQSAGFGELMVDLDVPSGLDLEDFTEEGYSWLQGDGDVKVLWAREPKKRVRLRSS